MIVLCSAALIAALVWFNGVWSFYVQRAQGIVVPVAKPKGRSL
jgi:hypothetical protein